MDFLPNRPRDQPKGTFECLAVISIGSTAVNARRLSVGSNHADDDTGLARVLSGGRRKSGAGLPAAQNGHDKHSEGTWYWRCRVGVTDEAVVILPASEPPNPVLNKRPHAQPSQHQHPQGGHSPKAGGFMGAIRRASAGLINPHPQTHSQTHPPAPADGAIPENAVETAPATNGSGAHAHHDEDAHRESGWPAVVEGGTLQAIVIPLHNINKESVHLINKKDYNVSATIGSAIAGKAGSVRFEFNKDWMGAKGESELLFDKLQTGVENAAPLFQTVQLSGKSSGDAAYNPGWQDQVRGKW